MTTIDTRFLFPRPGRCCEKGDATGVTVCDDCAAEDADLLAAVFGPIPSAEPTGGDEPV